MRTPEVHQKVMDAAKSRRGKRGPLSEIHRRKISESHMGLKPTVDTRMKMSLAKKGKIPTHIWKLHTPEARRKQADSIRGRLHTAEHKKKQSESMKGRHLSEEHKRKLSEVKKGKMPPGGVERLHTKEIHEKIRIALKGRIVPEDQKIKIRIARARQVMPMRDTKIELIVFAYLDSHNVSYCKHKILSDIPHYLYSRHQFDIVVMDRRLIIEVDGCYWHGCSTHFPNPNEYQKWALNRDCIINETIEKNGWEIIRLWEHDINAGNLSELEEVFG